MSVAYLADGQLPASQGTILAGNVGGGARVTITLGNNDAGGDTETITLWELQSTTSNPAGGGVARQIWHGKLAINETAIISGIGIDPLSTLLASTTDAAQIDYFITTDATLNVPMTAAVYDASGQLKTVQSVASGATTITATSANAFTVGPNGTTNPTFNVDTSTASDATGINIKGAAAASGVAVSVLSSGTNENLTVDAKGSGTITLNGTATGNIVLGRAATGVSVAVTAGLTSSGPTGAGVGYATGAGGAVSQITSRTTSVTLSKLTGAITLVSAAGSATPFTMTVTNTTVAATDTIIVSQKSGTDSYSAVVSAVGAGSFNLTITDLTGTTTEAPVFNFTVLKGVAS